MPNWIWYLGLTIISLLVTGFTLWKKKNLKLIPFYFFLSVIIIYLEYVIFIIFESYTYRPNVLQNPYFDNILGAVVSDFFSVPAAAFAIAAFQLNYIWMISISILFMGIEYIFLKLNIYEQHWWKTIYTGIGLLIHFKISKEFWKSLSQTPSKTYVRIISLYASYHSIHGLLTYFLIVSFNLYLFHIGLVSNPFRDHFIVNVIYSIIIGWIAAIIIGFDLKWYYRTLGLLTFYILDWVLIKTNMLQMSPGFSINKLFVIHLLVLILIVKFNSYLISNYAIND
ncbi:hypothetical protein R9X47_08615 [Wukongibacter baidiensis]|uniref:hypothetical protein n=1 Tax=Wukongibacter baidiensis TaxID=1723361 RepID=UPI003D7FDD73